MKYLLVGNNVLPPSSPCLLILGNDRIYSKIWGTGIFLHQSDVVSRICSFLTMKASEEDSTTGTKGRHGRLSLPDFRFLLLTSLYCLGSRTVISLESLVISILVRHWGCPGFYSLSPILTYGIFSGRNCKEAKSVPLPCGLFQPDYFYKQKEESFTFPLTAWRNLDRGPVLGRGHHHR